MLPLHDRPTPILRLARSTRRRRFHLVRPMATGGMSTVYHVFDRERGQDVALKRSNECQ